MYEHTPVDAPQFEPAFAELVAAAAEYRAAKKQYKNSKIVSDEEPSARLVEQYYSDLLHPVPDKEPGQVRKAEQRLIAAALVMAGKSGVG